MTSHSPESGDHRAVIPHTPTVPHKRLSMNHSCRHSPSSNTDLRSRITRPKQP